MDPSSGKNNLYFFFYADVEEEFLFFLYKDLGCRFDKVSFFLFKHVYISSCWVTVIFDIGEYIIMEQYTDRVPVLEL
jgi:hypothetical protein